jgi:hypothetical protein
MMPNTQTYFSSERWLVIDSALRKNVTMLSLQVNIDLNNLTCHDISAEQYLTVYIIYAPTYLN